MTQKQAKTSRSRKKASQQESMSQRIQFLLEEIKELYCGDEIPWVIGYSGGKDSTAILQLIWMALEQLDPNQRTKMVYVISTDTLVENPVISSWVARSIETMEREAQSKNLPIAPNLLFPELKNRFWVNLIGRGYPAPRHKFRWCTERLKIQPSNQFILDVVAKSGEAILVLGTRKAESTRRAATMKSHEKHRVRDRLSPNASLSNCLVYTPIEDWSDDDVWLFLNQYENPWGHSNKDLVVLYQGATADGECPLVVDTSTPSCGNSRFGCWVCTMVEQDKSMQAMILNKVDYEWMYPLLELRNELDPRNVNIPKKFRPRRAKEEEIKRRTSAADDRHLRDFRRMSGKVQLHFDRSIPGAYKPEVWQYWLRRVLEAQTYIRENGPEHVRNIELITIEELHEIRRIWVIDKHEIEDFLPSIFEKATGSPFPGQNLDDNQVLGYEEMELLREICGEKELLYELVRELLDVEFRHRTQLTRRGLFIAIEAAFRRSFYEDEQDATDRMKRKKEALKQAEDGKVTGQLTFENTWSSAHNDAERPQT